MDDVNNILKIGAIIQQALIGEGEATRVYMPQLADKTAIDKRRNHIIVK